MNERPAYGLSFPLYVLGLLVVPERDEAGCAGGERPRSIRQIRIVQ